MTAAETPTKPCPNAGCDGGVECWGPGQPMRKCRTCKGSGRVPKSPEPPRDARSVLLVEKRTSRSDEGPWGEPHVTTVAREPRPDWSEPYEDMPCVWAQVRTREYVPREPAQALNLVPPIGTRIRHAEIAQELRIAEFRATEVSCFTDDGVDMRLDPNDFFKGLVSVVRYDHSLDARVMLAEKRAAEAEQEREPAQVVDAEPLFKPGDYVESTPGNGPRVAGIVKWCGRGAGACVGIEDAVGDGSEWDFAVEQVRLAHRLPASFTRQEIETALDAALRKARDKGADSHQQDAIIAFGQDLLEALRSLVARKA